MMKKILPLLLFLLSLSPAMAQQTIDHLGAASPLDGSESVPIFQGSNPAVKTTTQAIANLANPFLLNVATYYVLLTGNDTLCNGTVQVAYSSGVAPNCAWATPNFATDWVTNNVRLTNNGSITIQIGVSGTSGQVFNDTAPIFCRPVLGADNQAFVAGGILLSGDATTPSNITLSYTDPGENNGVISNSNASAACVVSGFNLQSDWGGLTATSYGNIYMGGPMEFSGQQQGGAISAYNGGLIDGSGWPIIVDSPQMGALFSAGWNSLVNVGSETITFVQNPTNFQSGIVSAYDGGQVLVTDSSFVNPTFATGPGFNLYAFSYFDTFGAQSPATWPGDAGAGVVDNTSAFIGFIQPRKVASADLNIYVDSVAGSNSNPCTSAEPCADALFVWNKFSTTYDGQGHNLFINLVGAGPYSLNLTRQFGTPYTGNTTWVGWSNVLILGQGSTTTTIDDALISYGGGAPPLGSSVFIDGVTFVDTLDGGCVVMATPGTLGIGGVLSDWACVQNNNAVGFSAFISGANLTVLGNGVLSGTGFTSAFQSNEFGGLFVQASITLSGSPVFTNGFANATSGGYLQDNSTYSGSPATGTTKFLVSNNSVILAEEANLNEFPGDLPGIVQDPTSSYGEDFGNFFYPRQQIVVPSNAGTTTMDLFHIYVILNGAATGQTLQLPPIQGVPGGPFVNNVEMKVSSTSIISGVTWATTDGSAIASGFPAALTAGQEFFPHYDLGSNTWYP